MLTIRDLSDTHGKITAITQSLLNDMTTTLDKPVPPTQLRNLSHELERRLTQLESLYTDIQEIASSLKDVPYPCENPSFQEYESLILQSQDYQKQEKQRESYVILETFTQISSDIAVYQEALSSFLEEASTFLAQIEQGNAPEIKKYSLMLQALKIRQFDTLDDIAILTQIGIDFSPTVSLGVSAGKYMLPSSENTSPAPVEKSTLPPVEELALEEEPAPVETLAPEEELPTEEALAPEEKPAPVEALALEEESILFPEEMDTIIQEDVAETNRLQPTLLSLKKELTPKRFRHLSQDAMARVIVPILSRLGLVSRQQLVQLLDCIRKHSVKLDCSSLHQGPIKDVNSWDLLDIHIPMLVQSGILVEYENTPMKRNLYSLSEHCWTALRNEPITKNAPADPISWLLPFGQVCYSEAVPISQDTATLLYEQNKTLLHFLDMIGSGKTQSNTANSELLQKVWSNFCRIPTGFVVTCYKNHHYKSHQGQGFLLSEVMCTPSRPTLFFGEDLSLPENVQPEPLSVMLFSQNSRNIWDGTQWISIHSISTQQVETPPDKIDPLSPETLEKAIPEEDSFVAEVEDTLVAEEEDTFVGEEEDSFVAEEEDTFVTEVEDTLVAEEEDTLVAEEEDSFVGEEEDTFVAEEEDTLVAEEEDTLVGEEEDSFVAEEEDSFVAEEEDSFVGEEDDTFVGEEDDIFVAEENLATEELYEPESVCLLDSDELHYIMNQDYPDGSPEAFAKELLLKGTLPRDTEFYALIQDLIQTQEQIPFSTDTLHQYAPLHNGLILTTLVSFLDEKEYPLCHNYYRSIAVARQVFFNEEPDYYDLDSQDSEMEGESLATYFYKLLFSQHYSLLFSAKTAMEQYDTQFPHYGFLKTFFNHILVEKEKNEIIFTDPLISALNNVSNYQEQLGEIRQEAAPLVAEPNKTIRVAELKPLIFGTHSLLGRCLQMVLGNSEKDDALIAEIEETFFEKDSSVYQNDENKIISVIEQLWKDAPTHIRLNRGNLESYDSRPLVSEYRKRLKPICEWILLHRGRTEIDLSGPRRLKDKILEQLDEYIQELTLVSSVHKPAYLSWTFYLIKERLEGRGIPSTLLANFLQTGLFPLNEKYKLILDQQEEDGEYSSVLYYEGWRRMLAQILLQDRDFTTVTDAINNNEDSFLYDNLYQQRGILAYTKGNPNELIDDREECIEFHDKNTEDVKNSIIIAFASAQLSELEAENLNLLIEHKKEIFYQMDAFGCWNRYLHAILGQIAYHTAEKLAILQEELQNKPRKDQENSPHLREVRKQLSQKNFAIAEDYLHRYHSEDETKFVPPYYDMLKKNQSVFQDFCENFSFFVDVAFNYTGKTLNPQTALSSVKKRKKATEGHWKECQQMLQNWPTSKGNLKTKENKRLEDLLGKKGFGLDVQKVTNEKEVADMECFSLTLRKTSRQEKIYDLPVPALGTQCDSPVNILVLYRYKSPESLVTTLTTMVSQEMTFLICADFSYDLSQRREITRGFYQKSEQRHSFLLIDRALLLNLCLYENTERLSALLQCTLPFTSYQPFTKGTLSVSDEMFIGREKELRSLLAFGEAKIIYGGRQLGKTVLLKRAEALASNPALHEFALYCDIFQCDTEEMVLAKIKQKWEEKIPHIKVEHWDTLQGWRQEVYSLLTSKKIHKFYLFLDECDLFLGAIKVDNYKMLTPLVELSKDCVKSFKFVLSGLHNVIRAKASFQDDALHGNGILGQISQGHLCITPLPPKDALKLISRPLGFLGFDLTHDEDLYTILTKTNYYPGILQLFGHTLVQGIGEVHATNPSHSLIYPPYALDKKQLGAIMKSGELIDSIREKFIMSLKADEKYYLLALCMASCYFEDENRNRERGFSLIGLRKQASEYSFPLLGELSPDDVRALLNEMTEMGILSKTKEDYYRFRRDAFLQMVARDPDTLLNTIDEYFQDITKEEEN